jgi:hypothetical protein
VIEKAYFRSQKYLFMGLAVARNFWAWLGFFLGLWAMFFVFLGRILP